MRRLLMSAAVVAATLLAPLTAQTPLAQGSSAAVAGGNARVIVKYRADSLLLRRQALSVGGQRTLQARGLGQRIGINLVAGQPITDLSHVVTATGISSAQLAARLAAQSDVEYAVVDERKHIVAAANDSFYATRAYNLPVAPSSGGPLVGQWYLKPRGADGTAANTAPSSMNAEQAWDITTGSATIVVAVLDTGLRFDHPDLQGGNVLAGYDMVSEDSPGVFVSANDGNGRDADASDPGDFFTAADQMTPGFSGCPIQPTSSWHGTQTLGVVGARTDNNLGMASVGRNVRVLPVRVLGKCGGYDSDILAGMRWAAGIAVPGVPANATPAKVINMSLGGTGSCSQAYTDAVSEVNAAGSIVVASAGNSAGRAVNTPANCTGVIGVSGLRHVGTKVGFSDLGPQIALSAPGGNCVNVTAGSPCLYPILTTSNSGTTTPVAGGAGAIYTDSFNYTLGTSFSAPLVAATAALVLSVRSTLTPAQVKAMLQSTARPFPTTGGSAGTQACVAPGAVDQLECYCTTSTCGAGMLDARAAVAAANGVQAQISLTTPMPTAGLLVMLAESSALGAGQSIASRQWLITSTGTTFAAIVGSSTGSTVSVMPTAAGSFTIRLTTTDNNGFVSMASATVSVVAGVQAQIAVTTPTPTAGAAVALTSSSVLGAGQFIASYQWGIVTAGTTGAAIVGSSTGSTVSVMPTAAGSFTISLTTTDNVGFVSSAQATVSVAAAPAPAPAPSSGGGGALGVGWLLLLLSAVLALAAAGWTEQRRARLAAGLSAAERLSGRR